jgi:hypothetical protein
MRECRRLLATLKLVPERSDMIWAFVESYLQLTADELSQYEREVARTSPEEQEETMPLISSIARKGMHEGQERVLQILIERRFGAVEPTIIARLNNLTTDQLDELSAAILDFTSSEELESWIARHSG